MEAMNFLLSSVNTTLHFTINHPLYSAAGVVVLVLFLLHFYCRLTLGMCDCVQDMTGKTVLITGSSAGTGEATALDLARRNARVIMACRNIQKAQRVANEIKKSTKNQNIVVKELDLCSFESVRKCAQGVLKTEKKLHVLVNNAGMLGPLDDRVLTEDGHEIIMQANHLGHFLLTLLLIDLIRKSSPSRIINVSSSSHSMAPLDANDLLKKPKNRSIFTNYARSKLANVLFTSHLAKRLEGEGVTVNAAHPGAVATKILRKTTGLFSFIGNFNSMIITKSPMEGAQTIIHLAVSPKVKNVSGKYFADCQEKTPDTKARDSANAKRLFEISEKITGVTLDSK